MSEAADSPLVPGLGELFVIERFESEGEIRLALGGELDLANTQRFEGSVGPVPAGTRVVIDLRELRFIDSTGIRVLMSLDLRSRAEEWHLSLEAPRAPVKRVLDLCRIYERIPIVEEAAPRG